MVPHVVLPRDHPATLRLAAALMDKLRDKWVKPYTVPTPQRPYSDTVPFTAHGAPVACCLQPIFPAVTPVHAATSSPCLSHLSVPPYSTRTPSYLLHVVNASPPTPRDPMVSSRALALLAQLPPGLLARSARGGPVGQPRRADGGPAGLSTHGGGGPMGHSWLAMVRACLEALGPGAGRGGAGEGRGGKGGKSGGGGGGEGGGGSDREEAARQLLVKLLRYHAKEAAVGDEEGGRGAEREEGPGGERRGGSGGRGGEVGGGEAMHPMQVLLMAAAGGTDHGAGGGAEGGGGGGGRQRAKGPPGASASSGGGGPGVLGVGGGAPGGAGLGPKVGLAAELLQRVVDAVAADPE